MIKNFIIIAFLTIGLFSACKRFEEDPITLRTPEQRIQRGWYLQSCTLNGKDSMAFMVRNNIGYKWSFGHCSSYSQCGFGIYNGSGSIATYTGNWQLNQSDLFIEDINVQSWINLYYGNFTIIKLTTKELKIKDKKSGAILLFKS